MIGGSISTSRAPMPISTELHRLKTGRLFAASVGLGLWAAGVPEAGQGAWRAFGEELGPLFQLVDDVLDGDGYAARHGFPRPGGSPPRRQPGGERARRHCRDHLRAAGVVDDLAVRTA